MIKTYETDTYTVNIGKYNIRLFNKINLYGKNITEGLPIQRLESALEAAKQEFSGSALNSVHNFIIMQHI